MKRVFTTFILAAIGSFAIAQAPFTIVRPADGSRVREVVHVLIPKAAVPPGGYIGIYAQGKFIEATILPTDRTGKFYVYGLDTQARHLADGPLNLEAVLFENYQDTPRIINRSSVQLTLENSAAGFLPPGGVVLRYSWPMGIQYTYTVYHETKIEQGTSTDNSNGGRAASQSADVESFRQLFEVDNHYENGDGLVRAQLLPLPGHHRILVSVDNDPTPTYHDESSALSVFLRLTDTGLQRWGAVPYASPMPGTSGGGSTPEDLFGVQPLPSLPYKRVRPGSSWATRFQDGSFDLSKIYEVNSIVQHFPERGDFIDVEWQMGHPCAHIINSIQAGIQSDESKLLEKQNADFTGNKLEVKQEFWFALDKHVVLKSVETITQEENVSFENNFGGAGASGGPGVPSGGPMGGRKGDIGPSNSGGNLGGASSVIKPLGDLQLKGGGRGMKGGAPGFAAQGGPGTGGIAGFGRQGSGSGAPATSGFQRVTDEYTYILEQ